MERLTGFNQRNGLSYIEGYAEYLPAEVQMQLIQAVVDKCRRYEDAEAEGRLLVLPCKVGDVVYFLRRRFNNSVEIVQGCISMLQQKADLSWKFRVTEGGFVFDRKMDELGKNVFLTREEAEAASDGKGVT